jgi:hypothetical protein
MKKKSITGKITKPDRVKFILSITCLVHCLAMPLLVIALPAVSTELLHNAWVELGLVAFGLVVAGSVILKDFLRVHKHVLPALLLVAGFLTQLTGIFAGGHGVSHAVLILGSLLVATAFIVNWKIKAEHEVSCSC